MRDKVFRALDNALVNGYDDITTDNPTRVAVDLTIYEPELENEDYREVEKYVADWQTSHQLTAESLLRKYISEVVKRCKKGDKKKGKPWCLYTKDGSRVLGHHKTPRDAYAQEAAIDYSEKRSK